MQQTMLLLVLLATSVFAQDAPVGPADLISQADFLLQMNCGGSTGVSTYSVTTNDIAGNMTNPALANVWLNLANTYQWAQPSMSMDYLCANMQEFAADRDGAKLMGSVCVFWGVHKSGPHTHTSCINPHTAPAIDFCG